MHPRLFRFLLNLYPPYLGAGIHITHLAPDYSELTVEMPLRFYNRNYVGSHFGGSLYSMVDPFYMLMLIQLLGPDYIVWDKAAAIEFVRPGRGRVHATFRIEPDQLHEIVEKTATGAKFLPTYPVEILDTEGQVIARVQKTLYIRRKNPAS